VFFISYALLEPLTNVLLKKLRPSIFLPIIMVLWGICMVSMGLVHNFGGMVTARFFLGATEAGLFPGVNYYLSCWYKRSEFGIRAAIFFSAAAFAGSFGGLLAAAIAQMRGVGVSSSKLNACMLLLWVCGRSLICPMSTFPSLVETDQPYTHPIALEHVTIRSEAHKTTGQGRLELDIHSRRHRYGHSWHYLLLDGARLS
jgi:MFS family permease